MERSPSDQEREISELVRRAQKNPDRQGAQRRDALTRLIDLSHSRHSLLKSYAARHMHLFFGDFSDLEESVIDAVYDLCEDQMSRIRIEGYNAITQVSRARNKWIKRNADVLVQLLQSDDPDEVVVVKKALQEHLDMDPRITFGVLCDQITPVDEPMDDEDRQTRDRLRFLVLDFLTVYAKRNIVRYAGANSETEEVLVNGLLTAITKSSHSEVESIVKRLLVALPSYTPSSPRSLELLQHLLDLAKSFFRDESRVDGVKSLVNTRFHLGLAGYVSIEKKLVSPVVLLRFYVASFASKMTFDRLSEDDQLWITQHFAETLIACGDSKQNEVNKVPIEDIAAVRRQTVLASWNFFRILESSKMAFPGSWTLCKGLLQACNQEKSISKTPLPAQLFESVGKMQTLADSQNDEGKDETIREVQDLIRSFLQPIAKPSPGPSASGPTSSVETSSNIPSTSGNGFPRNGKRIDRNRPTSITTKPEDTPRRTVTDGVRPVERQASASAPPRMNTTKRTNAADESPRSPKRVKNEGSGSGPSLLSRLGSASVSMTAILQGSQSRQMPPSRQRNDAPRPPPRAPTIPDDPPPGGFSIKGAAKAQERMHQMSTAPPLARSASLLQRLDGGSNLGGEKEPGGRRKSRGNS